MKLRTCCASLYVVLCTIPALADVDDGLVGYWPFDGTALDASGNGHDGTVLGATLTTDRDGAPAKAFAFSGGGHIRVDHDPDLNLAGNSTIAMWMYQQLGGPVQVPLIKGRDVFNTYLFIRFGNSPVLVFNTRTVDGGPVDGSAGNVPLNAWHHVAAVVDDDNGESRFYVDGVLVDTQPASNYPWAATNSFPLVFGRHYTCADGSCGFEYHYEGKLDEIRLYDRVIANCEIGELAGTGSCNQAPDLTNATASPASLWPPNNKMVDIAIEGVIDADLDEVTITIDGISNNETGLADADGIGTDTAQVRAARNGKGSGRTYTISYTADDGNGGVSSGQVTVTVAHDQGKRGSAKPVGVETTSWGEIKSAR